MNERTYFHFLKLQQNIVTAHFLCLSKPLLNLWMRKWVEKNIFRIHILFSFYSCNRNFHFSSTYKCAVRKTTMFIIALMNFHFFRALASMECHVLELQDFPPNGQPSPLSCSRAPAMIRRIKSYYLVEGKQTQSPVW